VIVKQYTVTLPADYDMEVIRNRVKEKGNGYDTFPGLGCKVFMIREKGRYGAESNQYAPVYLWPAVEPLWRFVAGAGFAGIIDSFGWTSIRYWLGLAYARDRGTDITAVRSVSQVEVPIRPGTDLGNMRNREAEQAHESVRNTSGLIARAVGVDTNHWTLVRFDYWASEQSALPASVIGYEALHVSAPQVAELPGP